MAETHLRAAAARTGFLAVAAGTASTAATTLGAATFFIVASLVLGALAVRICELVRTAGLDAVAGAAWKELRILAAGNAGAAAAFAAAAASTAGGLGVAAACMGAAAASSALHDAATAWLLS